MQADVQVTRAELVQVASRLFALFLLAWAIADITYIPHYLHSLAHYINRPILDADDYWKRYYLLESAALVLRMACLFLAAMIFWKGGLRVAKLFLPTDAKPENDSTKI
jgi:hypothetical protein